MEQVNRIARTVLEIFDDIVEKDKLDSSDLSFLLEKIEVYKDRFDITLKSDVQMLLSCGMQSYEAHSLNFNWDTESISKATIVQSIKHRADKAFSVNVINSGESYQFLIHSAYVKTNHSPFFNEINVFLCNL